MKYFRRAAWTLEDTAKQSGGSWQSEAWRHVSLNIPPSKHQRQVNVNSLYSMTDEQELGRMFAPLLWNYSHQNLKIKLSQ